MPQEVAWRRTVRHKVVSLLSRRVSKLDELYLAADRQLTAFLNGVGTWGDVIRARNRYRRLARREPASWNPTATRPRAAQTEGR